MFLSAFRGDLADRFAYIDSQYDSIRSSPCAVKHHLTVVASALYFSVAW